MKFRGDWLLLAAGLAAAGIIAAGFHHLLLRDIDCTKRGGVYVRSVFGWECVEPR